LSEVLEGVLSESILDQLASDLGIEARVLRNHPFFRVLKGRVLLTYPLRVSEPWGWVLRVYQDADYDIGDTYELEEGEMLVFLKAGRLEIKPQLYTGAGWVDTTLVMTADKWNIMPNWIPSAGAGLPGHVRIATTAQDNEDVTIGIMTFEEL